MPYDATSGGGASVAVRPRCVCCATSCDEVRAHALTATVHLCGGCAHRFLRWLHDQRRRDGDGFLLAALTAVRAP